MSENKKKLPFKIIRSDVSGGYSDTLHQQFTGGVDLVNYHKDTYGEFQDNPLQSPFTAQWVGGHQFRHVNINEGNDNASNRPEGWHLEFQPETQGLSILEDFASYNNNDNLTSETYFEGDGSSEVRTRTIDNPGKKYFVLTNTTGFNTRFLKIKNVGPIESLTYTFLVNTQNFITYDFGNLSLEDPDSGENLVLEYSYDNSTWTTKKTIFFGSTVTSPTLHETSETIDFSSELPNYVRFKQTYAYDSGYGSDVDHYALTDIQVTSSAQQGSVTFYSHGRLNSPPAYLTRDGLAKRPVNTRNIKGANSPIGNFFNNYEVIQTSGRRITNNLIVDGFVAGGELTTQFITGSHNYSLPVLNSESGSKSVIVERFNAPGSKEESSRGALDREGEEMSPNISLPWRNYKIRKPFYSQLSQSTPQGGGSIHGVNRNTVIRAGNTLVDNGFLVRSLPGTDIQYSWITASSETSASELGGYQSFNGSYGLGEAYSDIEFISGSYVFVDGQEEFVDNYGLYSFVKDKKSVDLDTKTLSITEVGTSASYGEITNSPYTFTTWTSIRTGETLVARALRKNNIVSYQDPNNEQISRNYTDPVVTFKYKPLNTKLGLRDAPEGFAYNLTHTYANNISSFANKNLIVDFNLSEDKEQFYDFLFNLYTDLTVPNNPITSFGGYSYREIIWPREEYTGLDETRKRKAYYLDKPGYDRDGFDRQLGTQRAFWRDSQEDRKRSLSSTGGYSSSFGYISTEESGSSFSVNGSTILLDDSEYIYTSSFSQSTNLDSGIFNSISLMENTPSETLLFTSSFEVLSASSDPLIYADEQINVSFKRGYRFDVSGELNHSFVDFYGLSKISGSNTLRDLGSVYRNSLYKSQLTTKQYDFGSIQDNQDTTSIIKTEDDEIKLNPKLRYTAFVGGGELNASTYVQENFKENPLDIEISNISNNGSVANFNLNGTNFIIYGSTQYISSNDSELESLTVLSSQNLTTYNALSKILPPSDIESASFGSSLDSLVKDNKVYLFVGTPGSGSITDTFGPITLASATGSVYVLTSSDGETWSLPQKISSGSIGLGFHGAHIRANYDENENKFILFVNQPGRVPLGAGSGPNGLFFCLTSSDGINWSEKTLLATGNSVGSYCGNAFDFYSGSSGYSVAFSEENWNYPTHLSSSVFVVTSSNPFTQSWSSKIKIVDSGSFNYTKNCLKIYEYNNKLSVIGFDENEIWQITSSTGMLWNPSDYTTDTRNIIYTGATTGGTDKVGFYLINGLYNSTNYVLDYKIINNIVYIGFSNSEAYNNDNEIAAGTVKILKSDNNQQFTSHVSFYGTAGNERLGGTYFKFVSDDSLLRFTSGGGYGYALGPEYFNLFANSISNGLFSQTFTESDILFSTLDNGLQRTTEIDSGKKPFFDSYDDYISDIRGLSKEYSVLPEFKISDHIRYYVEEKGENFISQNRKFLSIDGVSGSYQSATTEEATTIDNNFYKTYVTSDLLKKHDEIRTENSEFSELASITVKLEGIKKLLPYNGFYPQDRITQIANLYEEYVDDNLAGGVLNVSYEDTQRNVTLVSNHPESTASLGTVNASSIAEFDGKYYLAVGYHYYNSNQGLVKIFSSSTGELLDSANWSQNSLATYTGDTTGVDFGNSVKLVSGSNGLNLFVSEYGTLKDGAVYQITSSDGSAWGEKTRISSSATVFLSSSANSYFGNQIDAFYDDSNGKFI